MKQHSIFFNRLFLVPLLALAGCNDFLDEAPSKTSSLVVSTVDQLDALLGNYSSFYQVADRNSIYGTDDYGLPLDLYLTRPGTFSLAAVQYYTWDTENIPFDGRLSFWPNQYRKIFYANMVLQNLANVSGPDDQKAELKAEAHLIRAYAYHELVNKYCLPLDESTGAEPGLPLKQSTSFEELDSRDNLERTYALIEADIEEALKITVPLVKDGRVRHWRGNTGAANAFAARYWLGRNDHEKALGYANAALAIHSGLVDYNTDMHYSERPPTAYTIDPNDPDKRETVYLKFPYTHDNQSDMTDMLGWKEFYYFRLLYHESWWYVPSAELLDLYARDTMDLRYRYHVVEGYSYDRGVTSPSYDYPGYVFFFKDRVPSGPTVAEMLLTKAECLARAGDVPGAMATVNILRAKRMDSSLPAGEINLSASTREEAIVKILEERRREMPFAHRWFDIRRFNASPDAFDDVVLARQFFPYTSSAVSPGEPLKTYSLPKGSRRFAVPIPNTELVSSDGKIEQNKY
ncbi:MAG: RagB/SusD family nutrient uptake outer membrane protein [Odoribacteraceae bacterium]|jgi:hypothetical protein|nr:RagB/SusD family nutrient uptake outer membrane protein [Odoribacteraceae bacterium]